MGMDLILDLIDLLDVIAFNHKFEFLDVAILRELQKVLVNFFYVVNLFLIF